MIRKVAVFIIICLFGINELDANIENAGAGRYSVGLEFKSKEDVNKDRRTMLDLAPTAPLDLSDGFTLSFDLKLLFAVSSYGYVFRIWVDETECLDLISCIGENKMTVVLNRNGDIRYREDIFINRDTYKDRWKEVEIIADRSRISCRVDTMTVVAPAFVRLGKTSFLFGANDHPKLHTTDVAPMVIKNIRIRNRRDETLRYWQLAQHTDDGWVYDADGHPARVSNGVWELNRHLEWRPTAEFTVCSEAVPAMAIDAVHNRVYLALRDSLLVYDVFGRRCESVIRAPEGGLPDYSHLIYNPADNTLLAYNGIEDRVLVYHIDRGEWSGDRIAGNEGILHHNRLFDTRNRRIVTYGGYGWYAYNSLLNRFDLHTGSWSHTDLKETVAPRYLASAGLDDSGRMLLLGGLGSRSGKQEEAPCNMFDLYRIDLDADTVACLGEVTHETGTHFVFSNSLVVDDEKIYTLVYPGDRYRSVVRLAEIDIPEMTCRLSDDSIPFVFQDTESFCDLYSYYDTYLQKTFLYTVLLQKEDVNRFSLRACSLYYPPLTDRADTLQNVTSPFLSVPKILSLALLLLSAIAAGWGVLRTRKRKSAAEVTLPREGGMPAAAVRPVDEEIQGSKIYLLGEFKVIDRRGEDRTGAFTGIVKKMFVYCLAERLFRSEGVPTEQLDEMFWYGMERNKVTNNRNVNVRKLRTLLDEIGGITFLKQDNCWRIDFDKEVYCDLDFVLRHFREPGGVAPAELERLLAVCSRGQLLYNFNFEELDDYKSSYSDACIEFMTACLDALPSDSPYTIGICNVILIQDSLHERAMAVKCRSLYRSGKKVQSKQCFDKFCHDYELLLGEAPLLSFDEIVERDRHG